MEAAGSSAGAGRRVPLESDGEAGGDESGGDETPGHRPPCRIGTAQETLSHIGDLEDAAADLELLISAVEDASAVYTGAFQQWRSNAGKTLKTAWIRITETAEMTLFSVGETPVTAGDIQLDHDVEIMNPELVIANLTKAGELNMVLKVERGRGYRPATQRPTFELAAFWTSQSPGWRFPKSSSMRRMEGPRVLRVFLV